MADMEFDVERAKTTGKNIETRSKDLKTQMKKVKESMEAVQSWWKGESGNKFKAQYGKIEKDVNQLIESVNNISQGVIATANAKQQEEDAIAAQLSK